MEIRAVTTRLQSPANGEPTDDERRDTMTKPRHLLIQRVIVDSPLKLCEQARRVTHSQPFLCLTQSY